MHPLCGNRWYKGDLQLIEGVQRKATKYILNDYVSHYKSCLTTLKLLPLSYVKASQDICFYYKCLHGYFNIEINHSTSTYDLTRTHKNRDSTQLSPTAFRTETAANFYSYRIIKLWNNLPDHICSTTCSDKDIKSLKTKLFLHYSHKLSLQFLADNVYTWVSHCSYVTCRPTWPSSSHNTYPSHSSSPQLSSPLHYNSSESSSWILLSQLVG